MIRLECNVAIIACDCAWLKAWKGPLENLTIYHEWKLQQQAKCKIYFAFFMGGIFNFVLANELCWHIKYDMRAKCNRHLSWDDPSQWLKILVKNCWFVFQLRFLKEVEIRFFESRELTRQTAFKNTFIHPFHSFLNVVFCWKMQSKLFPIKRRHFYLKWFF